MSAVKFNNAAFAEFIHDLHGSCINLVGFHAELMEAVTSLKKLAENQQSGLPEEFQVKLDKLMQDDLQPCLAFLAGSIAQLEKHIGQFDTQHCVATPAPGAAGESTSDGSSVQA